MTLRLQTLRLANIGLFRDLTISFNPTLNVICGANGVGKTTILEAIGAGFAQTSFFQRPSRQKYANGSADLMVTTHENGVDRTGRILLHHLTPTRFQDHPDVDPKSVIFFSSNRDIQYFEMHRLERDDVRNSDGARQLLSQGVNGVELKQWLAKRILFEHASAGSWSDSQRRNIALARQSLSRIDESIALEAVQADTFDIMVATPDGSILFEALPSGYRTILSIILGIIREVELRYQALPADEFAGIILIDEIDLHLHPEWQRKILSVLRSVFPLAQFIVTTHSPHVIQAVEPGEVIVLARDKCGSSALLPLPELPHGFRGWTVEEILRDVMGMRSTQSEEFEHVTAAFDRALDHEDAEEVLRQRDVLLSMLHPSNPTRKLIRLQAAPFEAASVE